MRKSITNLLLITLIPFSLTLGFAQKDIELMRMLIFEKTNALRAEKGLPELKPLDSLMDLAQMHSENMVKHNFYAHVDHLGQNPIQRAEKHNVKAWVRNGNQLTGIAENIAQTPWFENVRGCGDTQTAENLVQCGNRVRNSSHIIKIFWGIIPIWELDCILMKMGWFGTQNFR